MSSGDMGKIAFVVIALLLAGFWIFHNIQSQAEHQVGPTANGGLGPKAQSMKDGTYDAGNGKAGTPAPDDKGGGGGKDPMSLGDK